VLVTDSPGARLLVDAAGIPFDSVVTSLDHLDARESDWWTLGKLRAYCQSRPFLHFDCDVFLWTPLSDRLLTADVVAQNPEPAPLDDSEYYKPTLVTTTFTQLGGWLPKELIDYVDRGGSDAACTGIFGGCAWEDITEYARTAEDLMLSSANRSAWGGLNDPFRNSVFVEQYYLAAYCHARMGRDRPDLAYLFSSQIESSSSVAAKAKGYTHLISRSKRDSGQMARVRHQLQQSNPGLYGNCLHAVHDTEAYW
jgi:hypothetical protein